MLTSQILTSGEVANDTNESRFSHLTESSENISSDEDVQQVLNEQYFIVKYFATYSHVVCGEWEKQQSKSPLKLFLLTWHGNTL